MIKSTERDRVPLFTRILKPKFRGSLLLAIALLLAPAGVGSAADAPSPKAASGPDTTFLVAPAQALAAMADSLDKNPDVVIATVDGRPITQGEAADVMRGMPFNLTNLGFQELYRRVVDQLVRQKMMVVAAQKAGFDKDPVIRRRAATASEREIAEAWLNHEVNAVVTEQAVHARYDRDVAGKPGPEEVRARVILVETDAEARQLIDQIRAGGDFEELARRFSKDASAAGGGDIGYVTRDVLGADVAAVMFSLAPGQTAAYPLPVPAGFFIVRVEGRRQRVTPVFDDARWALIRDLRREAATAVVQSMTSDVKLISPAQPAR